MTEISTTYTTNYFTFQPPALGDWAGDKDGRSGTVVSVTWDDTLGDWLIVVDPGVGPMLELRGSRITGMEKPS
uniref:Uncharacterized protein n=1 Tax=viral metagenome TaxID=1070528 RepID=A0A6M3JQP3_9ZZZZ